MNNKFILLALAALAPMAGARERVYRCGNEYTNNAQSAQVRGCKLVEGVNLTIVSAPTAAPHAAAPARVDAAEQRARDDERRGILQAELRKAQARLAQLRKEYNGGQPDRQGAEARNYQKYLDRVAALKTDIARTEDDVAGIQRELGQK